MSELNNWNLSNEKKINPFVVDLYQLGGTNTYFCVLLSGHWKKNNSLKNCLKNLFSGKSKIFRGEYYPSRRIAEG